MCWQSWRLLTWVDRMSWYTPPRHAYSDWRVCRHPCCSMVVCHCFVTSSRSTDAFLTPTVRFPPMYSRQVNVRGLVGWERDVSTKTQARGSHGRRTAKQLAQIGKYGENGNTAVARRFERFLLLVTVAVIEVPSKEEGAKHGIFGDRCPTLCSPFTTMTS